MSTTTIITNKITAGWYRIQAGDRVWEIERQDLTESGAFGWWNLFEGEGHSRQWGDCYPTKRDAVAAITEAVTQTEATR